MAKKQAPQAEVTEPTTQEETPVSAPISFAEPAAQLAEGAVVTDAKPDDFVDPVVSPAEMQELQRQAHHDNQKRDFLHKVMEARKPQAEPVPDAAPIAPRIVEQTNAELAAGRALVERNEALQAARRPPPVDQSEGTNKAVFRPADYVPDQKKGQGNVNTRTL